MQGKDIVLMLSHLFRKLGKEIPLEEAVHTLSFEWRYGPPTQIRKLLSIARENEMISYQNGVIVAEFIYDVQRLNPNQQLVLSSQTMKSRDATPLY